MKELKTEIILNAPAGKIWRTLTSFEQYGDWNPFIVSIRGEARPGAQLVNKMMNGKKPVVFKPVVTRVEENKAFEWLGSGLGGLFKGRHYFILEPVNEQQTKLIHGEQFTGLLSGPIMTMIGDATLDNFRKMNQALKKRVEEK